MGTIITVVRHGKTEWDKIEIQQGHLNSELIDLGVILTKVMAEGRCCSKCARVSKLVTHLE